MPPRELLSITMLSKCHQGFASLPLCLLHVLYALCTFVICEASTDLSYSHLFLSPKGKSSWLCLMLIYNYHRVLLCLDFSLLLLSNTTQLAAL